MRVGGQEIEHRWWGEAASNRLPLVLLHEGLGSVALWRDFPDVLAERTGRRVFAYSRLGHGNSDPPRSPHTTQFMHEEAEMLRPLLASAGINRAILLGHSDGGSIAIIAAALFPNLVDALILEAPHVFVEDVSVASIERTTRAYRDGILRSLLAKHHRHPDVAFNGWSDVWLHPQFRDWNLEGCLPHIACPVLLVQGEGDEYGTLKQIEAIARQVRGPVESLVLPLCGHSPHRDQREAVVTAVTAFVRSRD